MKRSILSLLVAGTLTTSAFAGSMDTANKWEEGAKDAWIDGKAEATLLFNGNLNSFDINTDVQNGKVILTGKVDNSVDKKLAEELVANIDGVTDVDNQLTVVEEHDSEAMDGDDMDMDSATGKLTDAKIATVIKTRLLMDSDISGFDIDVDVEQGNVTLTGTVDSDAERDLAVEIAKNATDVTDVEDNLKVVQQKTAMKSE
ncbi:BON domain-containing protein [Alteromonas sp. RKMC-009]|uniref:BON domain-containing protein n=1 Tax=Alteromonas sp. RKMC-009 TaxID=2267264 RepID=UPI000C556134|nr:BON domain-containing protein [Alteromonas sp. RKMC-009]AYA64093.1 BON domain-containing protein [Alteromonas sp. RKMC-009]MBT80436.1 transporter [Alteromonadaceae bacterium]